MIDDDDIKLSTGKTFYANRTMVGINLKKEEHRRAEFILSGGYDQEIDLTQLHPDYGDKELENDYIGRFTQAELLEIADMVIQRWVQFKVAVLRKEIPQID